MPTDHTMCSDHRDWHDRCSSAQCQPHCSGLGPLRPHHRIAGEAAFGEDPDGLALGKCVRCFVERRRRISSAAFDLDEPQPTSNRAQQRRPEHARRCQQAQRPAHPSACQGEHYSVGIAGVIGDDDDRSARQGARGLAPPALPLDLEPAEKGRRGADHGRQHCIQDRAGTTRLAPHWRAASAGIEGVGDGQCFVEDR